MRQALTLHPDSRCAAVDGIEVTVARPAPNCLTVAYRLSGRLAELEIPVLCEPERRDGLWKHSCFEAFLRAPPSSAYYELNFAPSRHWAAYRFKDHRQGMADARDIPPPVIALRSNDESLELRAGLDLEALDLLSHDTAWSLGFTAVIEEKSGRISYWALAHPPGAPDFHHSDCFVIRLPAA